MLMGKMAMTKRVAVSAAAILIPLSTASMAFASTPFDTQYQANATKETALLQTAQGSSVTSAQITALSSTVQTINAQITALNQVEQNLAAQEVNIPKTTSQYRQGLAQLQQQRWDILHKSQAAWNVVDKYQFNHTQKGRNMFRQGYHEWQGIGAQLRGINSRISSYERANPTKWNSAPYDGALSGLQATILQLQASAIHYTNSWIALEKMSTSTPTTSSSAVNTPSATASSSNGVSTVSVSNVTPGATVNLDNTAGQVVMSTTANESGTASFTNVANGTYFVVQSVNGQQSAQSATFSVTTSVSTPSATESSSNGVSTVSVSNVTPGATVNLDNTAGQVVMSTTANESGTASFTNVANGTYFVIQSVNGQQSTQSATFSVTTTLG